MFSFFSRRAKAQADREAPPRPAAAVSPRKAPAVGPSVDQQRAAARRTAEQIDRIESEMIVPPRDDAASAPVALKPSAATVARPARSPAAPATSAGAAVAAIARARAASSAPDAVDPNATRLHAAPGPKDFAAARSAVSAPAPARPAAPAPVAVAAGLEPERRPAPALEALVFTLPGDAPAAARVEVAQAPEGVELAEPALPPELEEAAILFANAQLDAAAATLAAVVERDDAPRRAWLMMLDVLHATGRRADFEARCIAYAARFETSPPAWRDAAEPAQAPRRVLSTVLVPFGERIGDEVDRAIEQARKAAQQKRAMILDFSALESVDPGAALPLVRLLEALIQGRREVTVRGASRLAEIARATIEPGRRDACTGGWQLSLLALRLLGDQAAFEDLSIDYCVTFEVSPPSWEPVPPQLSLAMGSEPIAASVDRRVDTAAVAQAAPVAQAASASDAPGAAGALPLRGELVGLIGAELGRLRAFAADRREVLIDARDLRRLDFVAAGELLNEIVALKSMGKTVVIDEPSHVVEALLIVMGIPEIAPVRRRH